MIFITTYRPKRFMTDDEQKKMLDRFAQVGNPPGTTAHYTAVDGSHGVVITDTDDPAELYRNILNYEQWIDFDTSAVLPIEEALPHLMDYLG